MQLLLEAQANVNGQDVGTSATALMAASKAGSAEVVGVLLAARADPLVRDKDGKTALMVAAGEEVLEALDKVTPASARAVPGGSKTCSLS